MPRPCPQDVEFEKELAIKVRRGQRCVKYFRGGDSPQAWPAGVMIIWSGKSEHQGAVKAIANGMATGALTVRLLPNPRNALYDFRTRIPLTN